MIRILLFLITIPWLFGSCSLIMVFSTGRGECAAIWTLLLLVTLWSVALNPRAGVWAGAATLLWLVGLLTFYPRLLEGHDHHILFSAAEDVYKATARLSETIRSASE